MTVKDLHRLAFSRGLPPEAVHSILHDLCVFAFKGATPPVQSLKDCSPAQLEHLASSVRGMFYRPSKPVEKSTRKRSGRPARDGVVRMISEAQTNLINTMASELGWSKSTLTTFLKQYFRVETVRDLGTSQAAGQCIHQMQGIKQDRRRRQQVARYR